LDPVERRILVVACFAHMVAHFNMAVFPALVLPLTKVLGLTMPRVVELSFWHYLLFGITALPWGVLGDRIGGKVLLAVFFLGSALSGIACARCVGTPSELSMALAGLGLFSGIYHPIGMGLISKGVRSLSLAMGYNAVFGGLGLVVAPLITGIANWLWGPVAAFVLVGLINLLGLPLLLLCPSRSVSETRETSTASEDNGNLTAFLILLVPVMLGGMAFTGSTVVLPAYLELNSPSLFDALRRVVPGMLSNNVMATAIAAVVYLVGMAGQYTGGIAGGRLDTKYAYLVFHAFCIPAALMMSVSGDLSLAGAAMVYFFFQLGMQPPENTLVARFTPKRLHHSAFGLKFVLTLGVGSLAVKIAGWINEAWGLSSVFVALGIASVAIVVSIVILILVTGRQTLPQRTLTEAP
jgi:MFS family permease